MAGKEYRISDIYQGGYSSLKPQYGDVFTGYNINQNKFGLTTDPRTANVLQDASTKFNTGAKHMELTGIDPAIFESIPKQHLKELNRLTKLTGTEISVHAPIIEPSGVSTRGGFSEANRESAERQMSSAVERSHEINPDGNIPVTFHSSAEPIPGVYPKDQEREDMFVIDTDSGSIGRIPLKGSNFPAETKKKDVQEELNRVNENQWNNQLRQLEYYAGMAEDAINRSMAANILAEAEKKAGKTLTDAEKNVHREFGRGTTFLNSSYNDLKGLFDTAYKNASGEDKNKLDDFYRNIQEKAEKIKANPNSNESVVFMKDIINEGVDTLKEMKQAPQTLKDLNDFSKDKTVETFSNVAFNSFKKFGNTSPIISIENPPAGAIFSRGEDLKDIVEKAREKFVEKAKKDGVGEKEARQAAEKVIGVTWDVGHINMLKKYGYDNKDIIEESKRVAKFVKNVHLSDNFGLEHTELPMGMGNVPIKEILQNLGKEGFDANKIIEAGNWWQHFRTPPLRETLEAFGSPIYSMEMAPSWNQNVAFQQDYDAGLAGQWLPQVNYETFGAGFSRLPSELGGQRPGAEGSRMSGRGME